MSKVICYTVLVVFMIALVNIDLIMAETCATDGINNCGGSCTAKIILAHALIVDSEIKISPFGATSGAYFSC
uniref:Uncharacterized protein n=1 Tax=Acrobeloides nanus TaxID=290746 RepID=A0A914DCG1_9BILA